MAPRPKHGNIAVEFTFHNHVEKVLNWTITYNARKKVFTLTCKRGHHMDVPQSPAPGARETLNNHLAAHGTHT
jgi:hypothetical protein